MKLEAKSRLESETTYPKGSTKAFIHALKEATAGKSVVNRGFMARGGWTEIALGKSNFTLTTLKQAVRSALKASGCRAQPGLFCTREISDTRAVQFYVSGNGWDAVIDLGGTSTNAILKVSFSG